MINNKGKKDALASWLCKPFCLAFAKKISNKNCLRVLAYHRVYDFDAENYPFDDDLISASVCEFKNQLKFISDNFNVITFHEASRYLENDQSFPRNSLVITFDDGYADNYYNAFPLLKKYGLKAVFYLATDNIGTTTPFWFEKIAFYGKRGLLDSTLRNFDSALKLVLPTNYKAADWQSLRSFLIKSKNHERLRLLNLIDEYCQTDISAKEMKFVLPMTWIEAVEMSRAGMEIGSHTKSHLVLGMASQAEVLCELKDSKKIIEEKIQSSVVSVSYPIASHCFSINETVTTLAKEVGYKWGVSYFSGTDALPLEDDASRYSLRRLKVERYTSLQRFSAQLLFPSFFSY